MNYGKLTAGTTKTAIDTAKPSEKGEIITYLSRMGDVLPTILNAAMAQAFFSIGIGAGSLVVFGSYASSEHSTFSSSFYIVFLDSAVAVMAGLIIFPACFAFHISPDSGPSLLFITMPTVFSHLPQGTLWCLLFFIALFLAAYTSVISFFECNIICCIDMFHWNRWKSITVNIIITVVCTLPCIFGFNLLNEIHPLGSGTTILDFEDFVVSQNLIPLSALLYLIFAISKRGWGWKKTIREINKGEGLHMPELYRYYCTFALPVIIIFILVSGYCMKP